MSWLDKILGNVVIPDTVPHGDLQPSDGIHGIVSGLGPYTSAANRQAQSGLTAADMNKVAYQVVGGVTTLWLTIAVSGGTATWLQINTTADSTFSGDFGALFNSYSGLTVRAYYRGDLGVSGTTGTGKSAWANQLGDFSAMAPGSGMTNGIGTPGTGLNGKASLIANGATQCGNYTAPSAPAPATTNVHLYAIERFPSAPSSIGYMHSSNPYTLDQAASQANPAANVTMQNGGVGPITSGVVLNQWYRLRASFMGGTIADVLRIGAHAPTSVATSNTVSNLVWGWGGAYNATVLCPLEGLLYVHVEGPLATFLTAAADADAKAQAFWTSAIEI